MDQIRNDFVSLCTVSAARRHLPRRPSPFSPAAYLPARRATKIDAAQALRAD
jgi:hypothetical protein